MPAHAEQLSKIVGLRETVSTRVIRYMMAA
jgi:hypothetical protein